MAADQRVVNWWQFGVVLAGTLQLLIVAEYLIVTVQDAQSPDALFHVVREGLIDRVHVGEQRITAVRRHLDAMQDRAHARHLTEGAISVP